MVVQCQNKLLTHEVQLEFHSQRHNLVFHLLKWQSNVIILLTSGREIAETKWIASAPGKPVDTGIAKTESINV